MRYTNFLNNIAISDSISVNESSLTRVWKQSSKYDTGTISAYRYARDCNNGKKYTSSEKKKRNIVLKSKLLNMGYSVTKINGVYIENYKSDNERRVKEESFLVVDVNDTGKLKKDLMALGEMFEQDSITYSKPSGEYYIISTNKCPNEYPGNGKIGVELKLGKSMFGKKGEFFSTIKGRPFVFESIENELHNIMDDCPTHIRSIKYFANTIIK